MEEIAELDAHTSIDPGVHQNGAGSVSYGNPGQLRPYFYWKARKNEFQTQSQGKPVFDKVAYVRIPFPGTRDNWDGAVTDHFKKMFPRQWARFQASAAETPEGMPIKECPIFDVTEVETLNYYQVFTVEQCAELTDSAIQGIPDGLNLRKRAQRYQENAKGMAPIGQLEAEKKQLEDTVRAQAEMMKSMQAQMQQLMTAQESRVSYSPPAEPAEQKLEIPEIPTKEKRHGSK